METIIVNGQIFRSKASALAYCEAKAFRISGTETIYRRGKRTLIWSVTTLPADPASGYIAAQEASYFDNFCQQNNI